MTKLAHIDDPKKGPEEGPEIDNEAVVQELTAILQEPNVDLVRKVVAVIGVERAQEHLQTTLAIEAGGGLMLPDQSRRRTAGGVFFYTVRKNVSARERNQIWPWPGKQNEEPPPLTWKQARGITIKLAAETKGKATVKLTVVGRPKKVGKAQNCIVCVMEDRGIPGSMPKGLPTPPENDKQTVSVFIAAKQWRKVEDSLREHPTDELIVEGWPYFDPARQITILLAQGVTTKLLQRGARSDQSASE